MLRREVYYTIVTSNVEVFLREKHEGELALIAFVVVPPSREPCGTCPIDNASNRRAGLAASSLGGMRFCSFSASPIWR